MTCPAWSGTIEPGGDGCARVDRREARRDRRALPRALGASSRPVRFGCGGSFDAASSDVDVLVEFDVGPGFDHFGTYFDLKEGLERILGRPVDLVSATSIRNPYFKQRVLDTRELLYAARRSCLPLGCLRAAELLSDFSKGRTSPATRRTRCCVLLSSARRPTTRNDVSVSRNRPFFGWSPCRPRVSECRGPR